MPHYGDKGARYQEFTIPGTGGNFASEVVHLQPDIRDTPEDLDQVGNLVLVVENLPTSAEIVVDILKPGKDPETEANWHTEVASATADGLFKELDLVAAQIRLRGKSGGTAGTAEVSVHWDS